MDSGLLLMLWNGRGRLDSVGLHSVSKRKLPPDTKCTLTSLKPDLWSSKWRSRKPKGSNIHPPTDGQTGFLTILYCKRVGWEELQPPQFPPSEVYSPEFIQSEKHFKTQSARRELVALLHTICLTHFYQQSTLFHNVTALSGSTSLPAFIRTLSSTFHLRTAPTSMTSLRHAFIAPDCKLEMSPQCGWVKLRILIWLLHIYETNQATGNNLCGR